MYFKHSLKVKSHHSTTVSDYNINSIATIQAHQTNNLFNRCAKIHRILILIYGACAFKSRCLALNVLALRGCRCRSALWAVPGPFRRGRLCCGRWRPAPGCMVVWPRRTTLILIGTGIYVNELKIPVTVESSKMRKF